MSMMRMFSDANTRVLVLAAGEGSRLRSFTTTASGVVVPKQFCSLRGGSSLLHKALNRALRIAPTERICTIVASQHRRLWTEPLRWLPAANVIVQPQNRGTANGILMPLLHILERDPNARILVLPSDHYVRDEPTLSRSLRHAAEQLRWRWDEILMLGITPEEADPELGYIVPGGGDGRGALHVTHFVEKPHAVQARELIGRGGLWNAFIIAAAAPALLALYQRRCPDIVSEMRGAVRGEAEGSGPTAIRALYERLAPLDFSRHILEGHEATLRVLPVPQCGWSDLGTPDRVVKALGRPPREESLAESSGFGATAHLNLAAQHVRLSAGC